ncbi:unnamed protein product [Oppiella nova]|uniref:Uncharacterized protein n=1 Tax=Oppiella nova TaxID=334625 RepID=A0A7R9MQ79_9ACAR|nr:unnamed protein product [Oppiella nova]CAG2180776.1 unnamed protein product [Oppiella nova]
MPSTIYWSPIVSIMNRVFNTYTTQSSGCPQKGHRFCCHTRTGMTNSH